MAMGAEGGSVKLTEGEFNAALRGMAKSGSAGGMLTGYIDYKKKQASRAKSRLVPVLDELEAGRLKAGDGGWRSERVRKKCQIVAQAGFSRKNLALACVLVAIESHIPSGEWERLKHVEKPGAR
jgi:hypothetical protein